ncbi:MAG: rRNA maturation RNAse YbeY [Patescibacteria group bacterium]|nr:rRNA maturation RNAse YbeY [Patescibacteria group bacterium]
MVNIICPSRYKINRPLIKKNLINLFEKKGLPWQTTLNIVFIGKNKMKKLATNYKKEPVALPILSFPYNQAEDKLIGEIFICYPQAVLLAAERNKKVDEMINYLINHGFENLFK